MPRERQFTESEVLDAAADLFSAHGYQATSLSMLQEATGLGKQSLYNSFGDKRALYLKALDRAAQRFGSVAATMRKAPTGKAAVEQFLDHLIEQCMSADPAEHSCVVSAGLLEGNPDALINASLCSKWNASHELLRAAIERGQKDGSIGKAQPSAVLADLLMGLMSGIRVAARASVGRARLRQMAAFGLAALERK